MKYTIIDGDKKTPFIQQNYDTLEDVNKRLEALKVKFADRYQFVIVGVDDDGSFHKLAKAPTAPETKK